MNVAANIATKALGERVTDSPAQPVLDEHEQMNAIVWMGKKTVKYTKVPRPHIADPRDVVVRVTATTICGSDLHLYSGNAPTMQSGDIIGHEFMGIIDEIGSEVRTLSKGQRVVVAFNIACGKCDFCQRKEYSGCSETNPSNLQKKMFGTRTGALFGYSHLTGGVPGGQAEYVRVPFADVNCLPVPDDVPDDKALFLSDVVPTAYHGAELADVHEGDTVAIWGLGPVGLICAKWCQLRGASRVIGIECVKDRIDIARETLGLQCINFAEQDVVKTLLEWFPNGVDCCIECAGFEYATSLKHKMEMAIGLETDTADIFSEMFTVARCYGRVSIIGVYMGFANHFPVGAMMEKDLIIKCGQSPTQRYWKMCLDAIQRGELDPTIMVTNRGTLSEAPKLYDLFNRKKEGVLKVFLRPDYLAQAGLKPV